MTLGVTIGAPQDDLAQRINAASDGRDAVRRSRFVVPGASFEVRRGVDPSHGVNAMGGSSYTAGMPLLPSNAGLTGGLSGARDVDAGSLSWAQALNWAPTPGTAPIPLKDVLSAAPDDGLDWKTIAMVLGAAAVTWWLVRRSDG